MSKKLLKIGRKLIINIILKLGILKQHQKELFHGFLIQDFLTMILMNNIK